MKAIYVIITVLQEDISELPRSRVTEKATDISTSNILKTVDLI